MVSCKTVAKDTHNKYGILTSATQRIIGQMEMKDHNKVIKTNKISTAAKILLFKPN